MRARAVIGANFGDEGKGLVTDYLCSQGASVVVRFNGGAQAGHTVVTPEGKRHVFSHFGSGSLLGVPTFLSQFFICNPIAYFNELKELQALGIKPIVYAHPDCLVTTFADILINQAMENKRGAERHGSVGLGINETVERSGVPELKITMGDLWNRPKSLAGRIAEICDKYAAYRTGKPIVEPKMIEAFLEGCWAFAENVAPAGIGQCKDIVFEGAQGLLLDQNNKEFYPHLTRSNTGSRNVKALCYLAGISELELYYVSRTYLTRHGAGPLPGEDSNICYRDDTNSDHPYQGKLRFAPLDCHSLLLRCARDAETDDYRLVLTHCDQEGPPIPANLYSYGQTRNDFKKEPKMIAA